MNEQTCMYTHQNFESSGGKDDGEQQFYNNNNYTMCLLLFIKIIEILLLLSYKLTVRINNEELIKGSWYGNGVVVCNEKEY